MTPELWLTLKAKFDKTRPMQDISVDPGVFEELLNAAKPKDLTLDNSLPGMDTILAIEERLGDRAGVTEVCHAARLYISMNYEHLQMKISNLESRLEKIRILSDLEGDSE